MLQIYLIFLFFIDYDWNAWLNSEYKFFFDKDSLILRLIVCQPLNVNLKIIYIASTKIIRIFFFIRKWTNRFTPKVPWVAFPSRVIYIPNFKYKSNLLRPPEIVLWLPKWRTNFFISTKLSGLFFEQTSI